MARWMVWELLAEMVPLAGLHDAQPLPLLYWTDAVQWPLTAEQLVSVILDPGRDAFAPSTCVTVIPVGLALRQSGTGTGVGVGCGAGAGAEVGCGAGAGTEVDCGAAADAGVGVGCEAGAADDEDEEDDGFEPVVGVAVGAGCPVPTVDVGWPAGAACVSSDTNPGAVPLCNGCLEAGTASNVAPAMTRRTRKIVDTIKSTPLVLTRCASLALPGSSSVSGFFANRAR